MTAIYSFCVFAGQKIWWDPVHQNLLGLFEVGHIWKAKMCGFDKVEKFSDPRGP